MGHEKVNAGILDNQNTLGEKQIMSALVPLENTVFDLCNFNGGFYVDCGANDGVTQSNTYRLEKERGWGGILIDASSAAIEKCKKNRDNETNAIICAALSSPENNSVEGDFDGDLRGSVGVKYNRGAPITLVRCITLTSILKHYDVHEVDLWSLDVEGHELEALRGLDFSYCSPTMLVIEINGDINPIMTFMKDKGYDSGENVSGFTKENNPMWNGTHNDYLFRKL